MKVNKCITYFKWKVKYKNETNEVKFINCSLFFAFDGNFGQ